MRQRPKRAASCFHSKHTVESHVCRWTCWNTDHSAGESPGSPASNAVSILDGPKVSCSHLFPAFWLTLGWHVHCSRGFHGSPAPVDFHWSPRLMSQSSSAYPRAFCILSPIPSSWALDALQGVWGGMGLNLSGAGIWVDLDSFLIST